MDAYRSIRVKETERPHVKQVIVRNEDVSLRTAAAGPRAAGQEAGLKQRLKVRGRVGLGPAVFFWKKSAKSGSL